MIEFDKFVGIDPKEYFGDFEAKNTIKFKGNY